MNPEFNILKFTPSLEIAFAGAEKNPWKFLRHLEDTIREKIKSLSADYIIRENIAIHRTATVEQHVVLKGPAIISANTFIASHAYIRGGVFIDSECIIGPAVEIKSSVILSKSVLAHFNFVGDSIIGSHVNIEAGAVLANHYNEREDKTIFVRSKDASHAIPLVKLGAIVGDNCKIGANAVLSPGTLLQPNTVVARLSLIEQNPL